jgi:hypothetical protein
MGARAPSSGPDALPARCGISANNILFSINSNFVSSPVDEQRKARMIVANRDATSTRIRRGSRFANRPWVVHLKSFIQWVGFGGRCVNPLRADVRRWPDMTVLSVEMGLKCVADNSFEKGHQRLSRLFDVRCCRIGLPPKIEEGAVTPDGFGVHTSLLVDLPEHEVALRVDFAVE